MKSKTNETIKRKDKKKITDKKKVEFKKKGKYDERKKKRENLKMVLTVKVETDSGVALAKFIFSHYFILSTIFDRHVGDFQSGKV